MKVVKILTTLFFTAGSIYLIKSLLLANSKVHQEYFDEEFIAGLKEFIKEDIDY